MTLRFIHSSDLHIGRKFANIPEPSDGNIRGRLMEARHDSLRRLAKAAQEHGAAHVMLAGDTFDTATPSPSVIRHALSTMGENDAITWWILPGNHDNLRDAEPLWDTILTDAPANVRAVTQATPIRLSKTAVLLPCPVAFRSSASDPTEPLAAMQSNDVDIRIGLAHGGVTDFTESGNAIAPDRDRSARLDYLALGDWHGRRAISDRVQYSGTPEQDRFKHGSRGVCLAVTIDGPGARPEIIEIETGQFHWNTRALSLTSGQDSAGGLADLLPDAGRRDILLRVEASGWAGLPDHAALHEAAARCAPDFAHFELVTTALGTLYEATDLDEIDKGGALRIAADDLLQGAQSDDLSQADRKVAGDALARLYAYVRGGME